MENPSTAKTTYTPVLTVQKLCLKVDGRSLLLVRGGTAIESVLEQVMLLMDCMHALITDREPGNKDIQSTNLQYLNDLARAMVTSAYEGICAQDGVPT